MPDNDVDIDTDIGLLFECAPDSSAKQEYPHALSLPDLIGEFDTIKRESARLARVLLCNEPMLRGVRQLAIFEELVIRELQHILHAKYLLDAIRSRGYSRCVFTGASALGNHLVELASRSGCPLEISSPEVGTEKVSAFGGISRSWRRLTASNFDRAVIAAEGRQIKQRIDPFHRLESLLPKTSTPQGQIWYYTTAKTFTGIGMVYEPWFPSEFEYLVENPQTGGFPLRAFGRRFTSLYKFSRAAMAPRNREVESAKERLYRHFESVELDRKDGQLRDLYLKSRGFVLFLNRLLPQGLYQSSLFEAFIEEAAPAAVIVGNPVFEGYLLQATRKANIPTVLLQHGVLGDFCQFVDPPVDHYVVRGQFWKEFLSQKAGERAVVINPPVKSSGKTVGADARNSVVFITAPYSMQELWDASDLDDILGELLQSCAANDSELVIRVHPLEQISSYQSAIARLKRKQKSDAMVSYSQGEGLDELLARAAVAITFCSTVFLDCLSHKVPVISFSWHDFSFKRQIEDYGVFHFCDSLSELSELVQEALSGELPPYADSTEPFLDSNSGDEIRCQINRFLNPQEARG
jgi:hypothetical protein